MTFKVDVTVRKTGGGRFVHERARWTLARQWARFTNQVMGEYQLDSSNIHRLPEDENKITQMIDFLVLVATASARTASPRASKARTPGASNA